jgi:hypothetical protein
LNRWNTAFRFYVGRHTEVLDAPEQALRWLEEPGQVYCATTTEAYRDLVPLGLPLRVVHSREGMWVTSGQALWRRKAPPTEFVVLTRD